MISLGGTVLVFCSILKTIINEHPLYAVSWPATRNRVQRKKDSMVKWWVLELNLVDLMLYYQPQVITLCILVNHFWPFLNNLTNELLSRSKTCCGNQARQTHWAACGTGPPCPIWSDEDTVFPGGAALARTLEAEVGWSLWRSDRFT